MYMSLNYSNPDLLKGILKPFLGTEAIHDHLVSEVWFLVSSESSLASLSPALVTMMLCLRVSNRSFFAVYLVESSINLRALSLEASPGVTKIKSLSTNVV